MDETPRLSSRSQRPLLQSPIDAMSPELERYAHSSLPTHLAKVKDYARLGALLTEWLFIDRKVKLVGPVTYLEDCDLYLENSDPSDDSAADVIRLLRAAVRLAAHVLVDKPDELGCQILGRLLMRSDPETKAFLGSVLKGQEGKAWLRPLSATLGRPEDALVQTIADNIQAQPGVALSRDGRRAVCCSDENSIQRWDLEAGGLSVELPSQDHFSVSRILAAQDARIVVVLGHWDDSTKDSGWKVFDLDQGRELSRFRSRRFDARLGADISEDGTTLLFAELHALVSVFAGDLSGPAADSFRHDGELCTLAFTENGKLLIAGCQDGTVKVWNVDAGNEVATFEGFNRVTSVAGSDDGQYVISASGYEIRLFDLKAGELVYTFPIMTHSCVAIAKDSLEAVALSGSTISAWSLRSGLKVREVDLNDSGYLVALSGNGLRAISSSNPYYGPTIIKIWNSETGDEEAQFEGFEYTNAIALSQNGRWAAIGSSGTEHCTVKLWDVDARREVQTWRNVGGYIQWLAIDISGDSVIALVAPAGERKLNGTFDLIQFNTKSGQCSAITQVNSEIAAASPTVMRIAAVSHQNRLVGWNIPGESERFHTDGHTNRVVSLAMNANGTRAISAALGGDVKTWDLQQMRSLTQFTVASTRGAGTNVSLSHDGRVALVDTDGLLTFVYAENKIVTANIPVDHRACLSSDGRRAVTFGPRDNAEVWDIDGHQKLWTLSDLSRGVISGDLSADGDRLICAYLDHSLKLWDLSGQPTKQDVGTAGEAVAISGDGSRAASISLSHGIKIWDVATAKVLQSFSFEGDQVCGLALSKNGHLLFVPEGTIIRVLDWECREQRAVLDNQRRIECFAINSDGTRAVSGWGHGPDAHFVLRVWDVPSETELFLFEVTGDTFLGDVGLSADGLLVLASFASGVRQWDVSAGIEIAIKDSFGRLSSPLALSGDGTRVAGRLDDGIGIWDTQSGLLIGELTDQIAAHDALALSKDGRLCISRSASGNLSVWNFDRGSLIGTFTSNSQIASVALASDSNVVVCGDYQRVHFLNIEGVLLPRREAWTTVMDQLTEVTKRTLFQAHGIACLRGSFSIDIDHVFLALCSELSGGGCAFMGVGAQNVEIQTAIHDALLARIEKRTPLSPSIGLKVSAALRNAIVLADEERLKSGATYVDDQLLVLGMLQSDTSPMLGVLGQFGVTVDAMRTLVQRAKSEEEKNNLLACLSPLAKRIVFDARVLASFTDSPAIEVGHLLAVMCHYDSWLKYLSGQNDIAEKIKAAGPWPLRPGSADAAHRRLPLSIEAVAVLRAARQEGGRLNSCEIDYSDLLFGMLSHGGEPVRGVLQKHISSERALHRMADIVAETDRIVERLKEFG